MGLNITVKVKADKDISAITGQLQQALEKAGVQNLNIQVQQIGIGKTGTPTSPALATQKAMLR